jgi:hypothetical protein
MTKRGVVDTTGSVKFNFLNDKRCHWQGSFKVQLYF